MYVAVAVLRAGHQITCPKKNAPDVKVQHRDGRVLWIEAVAPTGGDESNPDRVVHPPSRQAGEPPVAYAVPIDQVTMRVAGALHVKAKKLKTYRDRKIIAPGEQALVAINVSRIPHGFYDADRYGLGAIYGIGHRLLVIDQTTGESVEKRFQHRPELQRASGAPVDVAPFLHEGFEHVTGAIISGTDAANCPDALGLDFLLLPNPNAAPPYTARQVVLGHEWRLQRVGDQAEGYKVIEVIEHQTPSRSDRT
jgi:hypothetical protein